MASKHRLTTKEVTSLPNGKYCDGDGLWLYKRADGGYQWALRFNLAGQKKEMGLGGSAVKLKEARELAQKYKKLAKSGSDPRAYKHAQINKQSQNTSLKLLTQQTFEAKKNSLKGEGKNGRWLSPIENHILPKLGGIQIQSISQQHIVNALRPIWDSKHPTAIKALHRLQLIFRHAAAHDIEVDLQAVEKAKLLLGSTTHKVKHIPAMHWKDAPEFYSSLNEELISHLALKYLILTGARSAPIRNTNLNQIDRSIWTIDGNLMKGLKNQTDSFRIPLSTEAMRVIDLVTPYATKGFLFTGPKGKPISDATMERVMQKRNLLERPHGFRTTLRTWLSDNEICSWEVAETILSHSVGNKVAMTYNRTDYIEQRRSALEQWAKYLTTSL